MERKRSFIQLKKEMKYDEFVSFCKKITEQYANSELNFARSYFVEKYNISKRCFYEIIRFTIETALVEEKIVFKAMNKAETNSESHSKGSGGRCKANYEKMYTHMCQYIAMLATPKEIKLAAEEYAKNPNISKKDIATKYGWNRKTFEIILVRAIEEKIVEDRIVDAMEKRSVENAVLEQKENVKDYFKKLKKKRETN